MKLRLKIAVIFTGLTMILMASSFTFIYFLESSHNQNDFYQQLFEKVYLTAFKYFEKDEMSDDVYQKVIAKYQRSLPQADEYLLNLADGQKTVDSLYRIIPENLINKLIKRQTVEFFNGEKHGIAIFYPDNQGDFYVIVSAVDKLGIQRQKHLLNVLLVIFISSIVLTFIIGGFYASNIIAPISQLLNNIRRIRATNLKLRLNEKNGNDEISQLIRTFNQMLDRLEVSFNMQKSFIHNASHELKNPLTVILGETELALAKRRDPDDYVFSLNKILVEAERLDSVIQNLLKLANTDLDISAMVQEDIRIDDILWDIKSHFEQDQWKNKIELHLDPLPEREELLTIRGVSELIRIAINNLVDNACKFSADQKVVIYLKTGIDSLELQIEDHGIGIPSDDLVNLGQPFFRADNAICYKGSGIGLSLTKKIIELHGGTILFDSLPTKGTLVTVVIPHRVGVNRND
jgi:signal transduction histidine kinase